MHIDYAAEALVGMESPKHVAPFPAQSIVEAFAAEKEFLDLALSLRDEKICSIAGTVKSSESNHYKKVTHAQKHALASALLVKFGTARAVYAAAFGVSQMQMFGEEVANVVAVPAAQVSPEVQAARIDAAEKVAAMAQRLGLPTLTGTDKQKSWAEQIRGEAITGLGNTHPEQLKKFLSDKAANSAKYWIECRKDIHELVKDWR